MAEINYKEFEAALTGTGTPDAAPVQASVYLIYGEELLYKKAHDALVDRLLPGDARKINLEPVEGANDNIADVLNRMNTYSLLSGPKVVSFQDARVFYARQDKSKLLDKVKSAHDNREMKKAARYLLSVMAQLGLVFDDLLNTEQGLSLLVDNTADVQWLETVIAYCTDKELEIPANKDYASQLGAAVKKGFPRGNHLIITTDLVDRRRGLFSALKEHGVVVNCAVPKGSRRADKMVQENVLKERMNSILAAAGKRMDPHAFAQLFDMTGFDLRTFSGNMEKLVLYVGDRDTITGADVTAILDRTREDPIYELTGAVSDRHLEKALFFLRTLLANNTHPLQILAALTNHMRKVLLAKAFTQSPQGRVWRPGMPFNPFKAEVIPAIKTYDANFLETTERWEAMLSPDDTGGAPPSDQTKKKGKKKGKKKNPAAGLRVAENPNNPYPVYLMLKKADAFTLAQLLDVYARLGDTDIQLKSSGQNPQVLLEMLLVHICREK